ncbi:MAG: hypothetical protein B9S26_15275 [Opitutia bacterium Tous-C4FEB]|nr:MAG: hypothetical protein B9S26_15275 [Opitutae bacterium Tous-C4FEB]
MNRIDRLVGMILFLQGRRLCRAEDIADHFEISLRTVYRDIAALGEAGVPIVSEAGVGYSLLKGYHLPPVAFTAEEASALATSGVLVEQMTDHSIATPMQSALLKIRAVLPHEHKERLERIERTTLVRTHSVDSRQRNAANLLQIQDALVRRRVLRLSYRSGSRDELTSREVEPLGLVQYFQHWHLITWCRLRQAMRDFRLDRIQSVEVTRDVFAPHENFHISDHIKSPGQYNNQVTARIQFTRIAAERARREWSLGLVREEAQGPDTVLTLSAGELDWFVHWILSFGTDATVLEPAKLRAMLVAETHSLAKHHGR